MNASAAPGLQPLARIDIQVSWQGQHARLTLGGELDWSTAPLLSQCLSEVLAGEPEKLTLDLVGLEFMDCAGVSPIAGARRDLPAHCPLILASPSPRVRRFLAATGIDKAAGLLVR